MKTTKVTINFEINDNDYDQYEGILQEFLCYMDDLGYSDIIVREE